MLESDSREGEEVVVTGRTIFGRSDDGNFQDQVYRNRISTFTTTPYRLLRSMSMFHREKLLDIGGFDPSWYRERMEVSLKLVQKEVPLSTRQWLLITFQNRRPVDS